jgi:hypothetical protein
MYFNFPGQIEFSKTNAQGRKRYKKKLKPKGMLATKEDRDKVKTSIQVVQEGRKWINTGTNLARMFK